MSTSSTRRVLVIGGGAREHTLCWSLSRGSHHPQLYCAPGNAGTDAVATNIPIAAEAIVELADWASEHAIDLTVVGPEAPLAAGVVDLFERRGLRVFGPSGNAAEIESSKCWASRFMARHDIPAPRSRACDDV